MKSDGTIVKRIGVDAVARNASGEVPEFLQRCALCGCHDDDDELICDKQNQGAFAQAFEFVIDSCSPSAS